MQPRARNVRRRASERWDARESDVEPGWGGGRWATLTASWPTPRRQRQRQQPTRRRHRGNGPLRGSGTPWGVFGPWAGQPASHIVVRVSCVPCRAANRATWRRDNEDRLLADAEHTSGRLAVAEATAKVTAARAALAEAEVAAQGAMEVDNGGDGHADLRADVDRAATALTAATARADAAAARARTAPALVPYDPLSKRYSPRHCTVLCSRP